MAGLNLAHEQWDNSGVDSVSSWEEERESEEELSLHLALRYSHSFQNGTELDSRLAVFPSVNRPGDLRARSEAALSVPVMTPRLRLRLSLLLDYDNRPAVSGPESLSTSVGASVGFQF